MININMIVCRCIRRHHYTDNRTSTIWRHDGVCRSAAGAAYTEGGGDFDDDLVAAKSDRQ